MSIFTNNLSKEEKVKFIKDHQEIYDLAAEWWKSLEGIKAIRKSRT